MVQQVKQDQEEEKTASLKQVDKLQIEMRDLQDEIIELELDMVRRQIWRF